MHKLTFFVKLTTFNLLFAMHGIDGKVNNNVLLVQVILHEIWGHAAIDDIIHKNTETQVNVNCVSEEYFVV